MSVLVVIPARYGSTRFPGKPLALIAGKPMIQTVWEQVQACQAVERCVVATDDTRIADAVTSFGGEVMITSPDHPSGTDRVWEVAKQFPDAQLIFNVQGDEPGLDPEHLLSAIQALKSTPEADLMTLVTPIAEAEQEAFYANPNQVKAIVASSGQVLYCTRAAAPFQRGQQVVPLVNRHIGLYGYRRDALKRFVSLPPSPLEQLEQLEQLRALEAGLRLFSVSVDRAPAGIDTPEDLAAFNSLCCA